MKANIYLGYTLKKVEVGVSLRHKIVTGTVIEKFTGQNSIDKFQLARRRALNFSWSPNM